MSVMGFQKKVWMGGGWGELYPSFFVDFLTFQRPLAVLVFDIQVSHWDSAANTQNGSIVFRKKMLFSSSYLCHENVVY